MIVGVQKCGTSTMYELLCQHHEVCGAQAWETSHSKHAPKELHVFNTDRYRRGSQWYRSHFKSARYGIDATPEYITRKAFMQRLYNAVPKAKILVLTRHPVDRFVSAWRHWSRTATSERWSLSFQGLDFAQSLERECLLSDDLVNEGNFSGFLLRGLYKPQLELAMSLFGPGNVKAVSLESLQTNRVSVMHEVFRWLGVDPIRTHDVHANGADGDVSRPPEAIMERVENYYRSKASLVW